MHARVLLLTAIAGLLLTTPISAEEELTPLTPTVPTGTLATEAASAGPLDAEAPPPMSSAISGYFETRLREFESLIANPGATAVLEGEVLSIEPFRFVEYHTGPGKPETHHVGRRMLMRVTRSWMKPMTGDVPVLTHGGYIPDTEEVTSGLPVACGSSADMRLEANTHILVVVSDNDFSRPVGVWTARSDAGRVDLDLRCDLFTGPEGVEYDISLATVQFLEERQSEHLASIYDVLSQLPVF